MKLESPRNPDLDVAGSSVVKQLRAAFESQLQTEGGSSIETWLSKVASAERSALFLELLDAELSFHQRHGRELSAEEYLTRFPDFQQEIQWAFEALTLKPPHGSNDLSMDSTIDAVPSASSHITEWANWASGDFMGRYRLESFLGRGAFGEVWKATDPELNRLVAIKLPRKEILGRVDLTMQFRDEARRAASLKDDGIVPVYDIGHVGAGTFIVSEFVDGPTLAQRMKTERISREEAVRIVTQLARSLHHAHLAGLVHRDIKPSNILMRPDGTPAITDFGLAISEEEQLTAEKGIVGTAMYMSPEQARGKGNQVDGRSDLYSLGVILFQLLTGRLPFQFKTSEDLLEQVKNREARPPRSIDDTIPIELERICLKCLEKNVHDRYSTGFDLSQELANSLSPPRWSSRRVLASAAILLLIVAGFGFAIFGPSRPPPPSLPTSPQMGDWLPMLSQPLEKIAIARDRTTDFLKQDEVKKTLTLRSEKNLWVLASSYSGSLPLRIKGSVFLDEWIGTAGFFWGLPATQDALPEKPLRCYALMLKRIRRDLPLRLELEELTIGTFNPAVNTVSKTMDLPEKAIAQPARSFVTLQIEVRDNLIEVFLDDESVWRVGVSELETPDALSPLEGTVGIVGRGKTVIFRDVAVQFLNVNVKGRQ